MINSGFTNIVCNSASTDYTDITLIHASENGYSEVYKALRLGKWHALKTIKQSEKQNIRYSGLLEKEFDIAYNIQHQNIVTTYNLCEVPGLGLCIDQEYLDAVPLNDFLQKSKPGKKEVYNIITELCSALSYIHSIGVTHRNVKPENILITNNGHHVKLIDFGLADKADFKSFSSPAGTTGYASPEQLRNIKIDNRSDIFSIGVVINKITYPDVKLRRIAKKCTSLLPDKRYDSAEDIIKELSKASPLRYIIVVMAVAVVAAGFIYLGYGNLKLQKANLNIEKNNITIQASNDSLQAIVSYYKNEQELYDSLMTLTLDYARQNCQNHKSYPSACLDNAGEYPKEILDKHFSQDAPKYNEYLNALRYAEESYYVSYCRDYYGNLH